MQVLPSGEFNDMIPEPFPAYFENLMTIAVNRFSVVLS